MQHKTDPRLAHPETALVIFVRKVRLVRPLEVGNVIAAQFDQPSTLQRVERLNDARAASVNRAKAALFVTLVDDVLGVGRPAAVERFLRLVDDLADRVADAARFPYVLGQPLMGMRVEEHPPRLERQNELPASGTRRLASRLSLSMIAR
ncbi:hypothetical protein BH18ACT12_BH18ACT12_07560 [soil metagenome]